MKKIRKEIRKILMENIFLEEELSDIGQNIKDSLGNLEKDIERVKKEKEVAIANKSNIQKTMGSIKDVDQEVERAKVQLSDKEIKKYEEISKQKSDLLKDLEKRKSELEKKESEAKNIVQKNDQSIEDGIMGSEKQK